MMTYGIKTTHWIYSLMAGNSWSCNWVLLTNVSADGPVVQHQSIHIHQPLFKLIMTYCQTDTEEQISMKSQSKLINSQENSFKNVVCKMMSLLSRMSWSTVYPKKYAHGFCFAVLCCGYTLTDFPISIRLTSLALWQSNDCPSASKATLINMDKYFMWIDYERLHNHNKAKHNKTVCIFLGIYCIFCDKLSKPILEPMAAVRLDIMSPCHAIGDSFHFSFSDYSTMIWIITYQFHERLNPES